MKQEILSKALCSTRIFRLGLVCERRELPHLFTKLRLEASMVMKNHIGRHGNMPRLVGVMKRETKKNKLWLCESQSMGHLNQLLRDLGCGLSTCKSYGGILYFFSLLSWGGREREHKCYQKTTSVREGLL